MFNEVRLIGRLGADPEIKTIQGTTGENQVAHLRVATWVTRFDDRSGEFTTETEWHSVVAWGAQCKNRISKMQKGDIVLVSGMIRTREWEDQNGNKRYSTEIVGQVKKISSPKPAENSGRAGHSAQSADLSPAESAALASGYDDVEDLPF